MKRRFSRSGLSAAQLGLFLLATGAVTALRAVEVVWNGSGDMNWTQPDSTSWSSDTYQSGDTAIFAGAGQGTVTLSGTITPGAVTVSAGTYTFSGAAIGGSGGLALSGAGTFVTLGAANTYAGDTVVGAGSTLRVGGANRLPSGAGKGAVAVDGTLSLAPGSHTLNGLSGAGTVLLTGESWESGTLTLGSGNSSSAFSGAISNAASLLNLTKTGSGTNSLNGSLRYRGLTTINGGVLALGASNMLSGTVTVNAGGTLRLDHPQAARGAPLIVVAGSATLDTAEMAAAYPLSAQTLRVGGRGVTATLTTSVGNGMTVGAGALHCNAYDGSTPFLAVTGGGRLTFSVNSTVTVTVSGVTPLAIGDYLLVTGGVDGDAPSYVMVNGAGRAAATTATLVIDDGDLILCIADYAPGHAPMSLATVAAGPWDAPATWQGGIVPGPGDSVTLNHAVTLVCGTHPLASVSNNATLTFNGWNAPLVAETVAINASVTHPAQSATAIDPVSGTWVPDHRVWIVCTNLTLNAGKKIDTAGRGYGGLRGPGGSNQNYGGGSYGGSGEGTSGLTYGSATAPVDPGSGGRGGNDTQAQAGGAGGGVVRIDASGAVTLHGTVSANGAQPSGIVAGCGSGGSIHITCRTLAGNGTVSAAGETSSNGYVGGGGGGRIAVVYDPSAQGAMPLPGLAINANGGRGGDLGTLYFADNRLLASPMRHSGQWMVPGTTNWSSDSLLFIHSSLRFPEPGFILNVTNDLVLTGAGDTRRYGLQMTDARISCDGSLRMQGCNLTLSRSGGNVVQSINVGGDFAVTNAGTVGSVLHMYAAKTNGAATAYGALVNVAGTLSVSSGSTLFPYSHGTDGGSVHFAVGSLILATGGLIDANARGYDGLRGPGASGGQDGASYGGRGAGTGAKNPYGNEKWPTAPGSGGGTSDRRGGGLVWIEADKRMTIDGTIRATGADGGTWMSSASGGGVALRCRWLAGIGTITATGGTSVHDWTRGAGGRIAIWYLYDNTTGLRNNVAAARGGTPAENGTVFWGPLNPPGTVLLLH